MKVNHLNLTVTDVQAAKEFLETYFGLTCQAARGNSFAALFDDDGLVLTLMKGKEVNYPSTFHIGFIRENKPEVNTLHRQLKEDGFHVTPPQQAHAWTFYVEAPGGFTVEVMC